MAISLEARIDQIINEKTITAQKNDFLALPPVVRPSDGAAAMLYDYAYDPMHETHPQHTIARALFENEGTVPASDIDNTVNTLKGMYEPNNDGSITSPVVVDVFVHERAASELSKQAPPNRGEGYAGKALQVKRLY